MSKGVTITQPDPAVQKSIDDFAKNVGRKQAIEAGKTRFGLADPEGLIKRFEERYAKWETLLKGVDRMDAAALAKVLKANLYDKIDEKTYGLN